MTRVSPLWVTLKCTFAVSLCVAVISGVTWFLEVATAMGEGETDDAGTLAVLTGTQFGRCCLLRLAMAAALACCFPMFNPPGSQSGPGWGWSTATLAAGFAASLAWTGHAGAMPGVSGRALLLSDILHLVAVSSWVGGSHPSPC